jgi:hypothetical protein
MHVTVRQLVAPASPEGTVRLWVGVLGYDDLPTLSWRVVSVDVPAPTVVRPLAPSVPWADRVRAATSVVDLSGMTDGAHTVEVTARTPEEQSTDRLAVRVLPRAIPDDPNTAFNVLLVSCFYQPKDKSGRAGALVENLSGQDRPHLVLTVGDQVYLDVPATNLTKDRTALAAAFTAKYAANFAGRDGYTSILRAAPVAAVPDDHEYWNNYPHRSAWLPPTWTDEGRASWRQASRALYDAFQLGAPDQYTYRFDVHPLSFFMMDNRTFRDADTGASLRPADKNAYQTWVAEMCESRMVPVIATGPSLFQRASTGVAAWVDRNLANYRDYRVVMEGLIAMARAGRPVLALTGDVHYARVLDATLFGTDAGVPHPFGRIREVIASPTCLVASQDHRAAATPPQRFHPAPGAPLLQCRAVFPEHPGEDLKGNNLAMLTFRRHGSGVQLTVRYWPVTDRPPYASRDLAPTTLPL